MNRRRVIAATAVAALLAFVGWRGWGTGLFATAPVPAEIGLVPTADPTRVRFVAVGDTGNGNRTQHAVARAMGEVCAARGCDLGLLLGDNLYPRGMSGPDDPAMDRVTTEVYGDLPFDFYAVLGNHDYGDSTEEQRAAWQVGWARRTEQFVMPQRFYGFSAGPARFWALDTNMIFWHGGAAQGAWVDLGLPLAPRWRVAFGHHTYRSEGRHGNAGSYEGYAYLPYASGGRMAAFVESHLCGEVDLYLSGHDHNLQWLRACGLELVVSGAGSDTRPLEGRGNDPLFASDSAGFAWIELAQEGRVAFYDADARLLYEGTFARGR